MLTPYDTNLSPELAALKVKIEDHARDYGLDFYETIFEVIDADDLNEIAAYGGFPTRYPHWSFGMSYEELKKGYDYGLSKIYEMVINNDPCYAYLMRCNHLLDQKLVMAHVYGHCDFFKNNAYFSHTNRKMMDEMANHGARIRRYVEKHGEDEVEGFVDRCMSIDDLIDIHSTAIKRYDESTRFDFGPEKDDSEETRAVRFKSKDYMDDHINPPERLKAEEQERRERKDKVDKSFPPHPQKDVLLFLIEHAPLKPWQRDVLSIIRDEAYYFMPQAQTKIINEGWACLSAGHLVFTDQGLLRIEDIVNRRLPVAACDGASLRNVYDWAAFEDRATIRVRTRRGLEIEGSETHRLLMADETWKRLDAACVGDKVKLAGGQQRWARDCVELDWQPQHRVTLQEVADRAGVDIETVIRYRKGVRGRHSETLAPFVEEYESDVAALSVQQNRRADVRIPTVVDEKLGAFLGYLVGDGHVSEVKRTIGITTADEQQAVTFASFVDDLFAVPTRTKWDAGRWRVSFSSRNVEAFLVSMGLKTGVAARVKEVPEVILRSPREVAAAFLRAYFDCDGYAGKQGVILSTSSEQLAKVVQLLLLNFGILSHSRLQSDDCRHVHVMGKSAAIFRDEISFGLQRKQAALEAYLDDHQWFKAESWDDEIVAVEHGRATVYDLSVEETHRYAAHGFVNHNSYWHSTILTQKALAPSELIDYADHHSGTMAMTSGRLNPYKLGIELLRDIEMRWNTGRFGKDYDDCDDLNKRRAWNKDLGLGREKIFEVRKVHNDITFIDTFLTPEFCVEHKLFSFAYQEQAGVYYIDSRDFEKIKQRLLFSLTNFGKPWIEVVDGNFGNRGELLLVHKYAGVELRLDYAADTLANVQFVWGRPVHLQTVVDDKPTLLSFDGRDHNIRTGGELDEVQGDVAALPV